MRAREFANTKLVIFDIDDTLVNTDTKVGVVRDGKTVRQLNSHDFTHYKLQPGEEFDFGAFRDAQEFFANARPIAPMIRQLRNDIATGNKVIMVTARADFDDRETFLNTFRKYGVDMDRVHVYRAGNIGLKVPTEEKKKMIIRRVMGQDHYDKVIMYDDALPNLQAFLSLASEYPWSRFYAWHVDRDGSATEYHRSNVKEDIAPRAAGCILYAEDTGRWGFQQRSDSVSDPGIWSTWGGGREPRETVAQCVRRELAEEAGYRGPIQLTLLSRHNGYMTFVGVVPHEFEPMINSEVKDWCWVTAGDWPSPMHANLAEALGALTENVTPQHIHQLADRKGVSWDNDPEFLALTQKLTGKAHLDDLDQAGLRKVHEYLTQLDENFADGKIKGRSRPGRVKRSGASCDGSVTDLRARAKKYGGERGRMYHWCANMKSGRKK